MLNLPSPWPEFLADVDQSLSEAVELHCLGGFVLEIVYGVSRTVPTGDLDYISAHPSNHEELNRLAGQGSALAKKHKVFLQLVGVGDYPENYESRLKTLELGLGRLNLRVLEPYDLVLSKLTRNNPKDMQDVKSMAKKLNLEFDILRDRFSAEMSWVPNRERHETTLNVVWKEYFASENAKS
jgi:Nucleotidyltransferase of unknown function (DUF6036)